MHRIIDFHTHTFPDYIADRAVDKLRKSANSKNYLDGTDKGLIGSVRENGISRAIVLPVATRPGQANEINARSVKKNLDSEKTGLEFFAAIHPDDINVLAMLSNIKAAGFKGIKLHPVFQDVYIDEYSYLKIIDAASSLDLITVIHAGYDISYAGVEYAGVKYILNMIEELHPKNLVLAHMGGWNEWDMVESDLCGAECYFDTSFCLTQVVPFDETNKNVCSVQLQNEQFLRIVKKHGADKILFGSDSPWSMQGEVVGAIESSGLSPEDVEKVLYQNAYNLLNMK